MDVMYKKPQNQLEEANIDEEPQEVEEARGEERREAESDDEDADLAETFLLEEFPADDLLPDLSFTYQEAIGDLRQIEKTFRH